MKPNVRAALVLIFLAGLGGSIVAETVHARAYASRNSSGTYTLPAGNPVTTKTTITSAWANATFSDVGVELTNSLDRAGRGAMTAPLQLSSGAVSAPGLTFASEPASGLYRAGAGDIRLSVGSTDVEDLASTGVTFPLAVNTTGTLTTAGAVVANGAVTLNHALNVNGVAAVDGGVVGVGVPAGGAGGVFQGGSTSGNGVVGVGGPSSTGVIGNGGTSGGPGGQFTGGSGGGVALLVNAGGVRVGTAGTVITTIFGKAVSVAGSSLAAGACISTTSTVTGATTTGTCSMSVAAPQVGVWYDCHVTSSNTVTFRECTAISQSVNGLSGNIQVFQP